MGPGAKCGAQRRLSGHPFWMSEAVVRQLCGQQKEREGMGSLEPFQQETEHPLGRKGFALLRAQDGDCWKHLIPDSRAVVLCLDSVESV